MSEQKNALAAEAEYELEEPLGNPAPPPDVDLEKLRGDRIGDTVFSGKWCIQTVMKLIQSRVALQTDQAGDSDNAEYAVEMEEELQNEVGALWDMTSNVQVCQYLHSVGAVESICYVISNSRCPRATEMCVGIMANIIYHRELWNILKNDKSFFIILIQLLTATDQPVLLEVNRFFNTALCHKDCEVFYSALNENGPLVVQELLRILSGSTNGELLKQVTELVYSLMYRDELDAEFNLHFADPDFVMAVVEASKELGLGQESPGQNYVMEIFHSFTTYQAGVEALGPALEEVSASGTTYLRTLCQHGLTLAGSCQVVTAILSTVHHVMPRSRAVQHSLLTSPSFLHCVLMTLVALYRKLGLYHIISTTSRNGQALDDQAGSVERCQLEEEKLNMSGGSKNLQGSWSERARAGSVLRTPEASPRPVYQAVEGSWSERARAGSVLRTPEVSPRPVRELEVSWSERRLASPLVEDDVTDRKWKLPRERRRLKKKEAGGSGDSEIAQFRNPEVVDGKGDNLKREAEKDNLTPPSRAASKSSGSEKESALVSPRKDDSSLKATGASIMRSLSGGFVSGSSKTKEETTQDSDISNQAHSVTAPCSAVAAPIPRGNGKGERLREVDLERQGDTEKEEDHVVEMRGGLRYRTLLGVLRELLLDYLTSLSQISDKDDGPRVESISATVNYLDSQGSSPELLALIKCVQDSLGLDPAEVTEPESLARGRVLLLEVCDKFQALHLKSVLLGSRS